ncbi:deleted in malignant brain tumors 1 protein-like, partial [Actinia tenebrosa]|uniref:Deleted in malignant brain tumors 1 protein-like n=1 Tax=Actinia tenebrosa TaxID=6105 RepID=A0A6P8IEF1_ACTTE
MFRCLKEVLSGTILILYSMRNTTYLTLIFSLWLALTLPQIGFTSTVHVRLVDNTVPNAGRVEIGYKGVWKSVCGTNWYIREANVACRMMGYNQGAAAAINGMTSSDDAWPSIISCRGQEDAITFEECTIRNRKFKPCAHDRRAGVVCKSVLDPNITVRLVDGRTRNQGRVEVRYFGIWGTVCDDDWDLADAHVVCRMLNYSKALWAGTVKVKGSGPILLDNLMCNGKERSLEECRQKPWGKHDCHHGEDANVTCEDRKHQSSFDVQVRLTGGQSHFGQVEVRYNGTWIPVCDDTWDISDAHVICRMLGFNRALVAIPRFSVGQRGFWLSGLGCNGDEHSISECYHHGWMNNKYRRFYNAAVICKVHNDQGANLAVRLMNGSTPNEGRVEVRYYGVWGTVCSFGGWGLRDAHVVCRMLNYSRSSWAGVAKLKGSGLVLLDNLKCNGNEKSLEHCPDIRWGRNYCSHYRDAGVKCEMTTQEESSIIVRLVKKKQKNVGGIEVKYNGTWRPVCDDSWSILEAIVACRMLGYETALAGIKKYSIGKDGSWMGGVVCSGDELSIGKCSHRGWSNTKCHEKFYAGVVCVINKDPPPVQIRLEDGSLPNSGRVAVRYGNVWGTICNKGLDINDAKVICRMLGYTGARKVYPVNSFVLSSDIIWLSDLECNGTENSIVDCRHPGWGQTKTCKENDGGVVCTTAGAPPIQIRDTKDISYSNVVIF